MDDTPRQMRIDSRVRGVVIATMIAAYSWLFRQPQGSFAEALLIAALLQVIVILLRRWVPAEGQPAAMYAFEMIADGITVLMFALGVFGSIQGAAAQA
jgi:hypothetical protein